ncbi:Response regulator MprA [compost metagenome]
MIAVLLERSTEQLIDAFAAGASDVVDGSVPFKELETRMEHLVKLFMSMNDGQPSEIIFEDLRIEPKSRKVFRAGEIIKLTPKEYDLLMYLTKRANTVCEREAILQEVWGYDFATGTNVVDVYVRHLRKKIDRGRTRKIIHTVRGTGYMIH